MFAITATVFVAAVRADGYHAADLQLNDAAVWVTNSNLHALGRLNTEIETIDTRLSASGPEFDVLQSGSIVLLEDRSASKLVAIDVKLAVPAAKTDLPEGVVIALGAETAAALEPATGRLWVTPASAITGVRFDQSPPVSTVGAD